MLLRFVFLITGVLNSCRSIILNQVFRQTKRAPLTERIVLGESMW